MGLPPTKYWIGGWPPGYCVDGDAEPGGSKIPPRNGPRIGEAPAAAIGGGDPGLGPLTATALREEPVPRVLICDDSMFARHTTRRILTDAGHDVVGEAENGEDAITRFRELRPDLLVVDLVMPRLNGTEAIRRIVAEHPDARAIVCSATGQEKLVTDALEAGARGYVVKPVQPTRLGEVIRDALR